MRTFNSEPVYAPFYDHYIRLAGRDWLQNGLTDSLEELLDLLLPHQEEWLQHRYAPGKWTVAELLVHVLDAELIFLSRALFIARQPGACLPGYDQDVFVSASRPQQFAKGHLMEIFQKQRDLTIFYFQSFDAHQLSAQGTADGQLVNVMALGAIAVGHMRHHTRILQDRYQ
jgi:uncharacterized damage-inducible protein DinB